MVYALIALVFATQTSTVPEWATPVTIQEEDPEKDRLERRARRAQRRQDRKFELDTLEREQRWSRDRGFRLALHARGRFAVADGLNGGLDAALGFNARLSRWWLLQARAAIGAGYGRTEKRIGGPLASEGEGGPTFDAGLDASLRVGPNRFFFGVGPFGRTWKIFVASGHFDFTGGGMIEFGWWFGEDRQIELGLRLLAGVAVAEQEVIGPFVGTSVDVGWIL